MIIFPAIDIKDGKCVRLIKGDFDKVTSYKETPKDQATKFFQNGFNNIHTKQPVLDNTVYRIWSMTKPIVAVVALKLIEQNK